MFFFFPVRNLFRGDCVAMESLLSGIKKKMGDASLRGGQWCGCWEDSCLITTVFRTVARYLLLLLLLLCLLFFPWSQLPSPYEECRVNWLCKAKAGGRAEGWSIKLVNHFLFSLRTAVDWRERPLCPPSQPASKFAASPFQCMTACCGGEEEERKGL